MAIAHVATEYVFSDFLLKDPTEAKYKGVRLELAVDKIVTFLAVGLPLFLISLAFAQEVSVGELLLRKNLSGFSLLFILYSWAPQSRVVPDSLNLHSLFMNLFKLTFTFEKDSTALVQMVKLL